MCIQLVYNSLVYDYQLSATELRLTDPDGILSSVWLIQVLDDGLNILTIWPFMCEMRPLPFV